MSTTRKLKSGISVISLAHHVEDNQQRTVSLRDGDYWMDGQACLANLDKIYTRPWDGCIPIAQLSRDNLPPFYVRLRDDQAVFLKEWVGKKGNKFSKIKLGHFWPHDFTGTGELSANRTSWVSSKASAGHVPQYRNLVLYRTFTSSGKMMAKDFSKAERDKIARIRVDVKAELDRTIEHGNPRQENNVLAEELKVRNQRLEKLNDELSNAKTQLEQKEAQINGLRNVVKTQLEQKEAQTNELRSVKTQVEQKEAQINELRSAKTQLEQKEAQIKELRNAQTQLEQKEAQIKELRNAQTQLEQKELQTKRVREGDDVGGIPSPPEKKPKYLHHQEISQPSSNPPLKKETTSPTGSPSIDSMLDSLVTNLKSERARQEQEQWRVFCADYADLHARWQAYDRGRTDALVAARERERRRAEQNETQARCHLQKIKTLVCQVVPEAAD